MKITGRYETVIILNASKTDDEINALIEKFKSLISSEGTIESVDLWGKKALAYEIDDMREGYYVMIRFSANPEFPRELDRVYRITDGVMRTLVIRLDEEEAKAKAPEKPAPKADAKPAVVEAEEEKAVEAAPEAEANVE